MEINYAEQLKADPEKTITITVDLDDPIVQKHVTTRASTECVVPPAREAGGAHAVGQVESVEQQLRAYARGRCAC